MTARSHALRQPVLHAAPESAPARVVLRVLERSLATATAALGGALARWRGRIRGLFGAEPPAHPDDAEAFRRYASEGTARFGQVLLAFSAALALALAPTDWVFFRDAPEVRVWLQQWRIGFVALAFMSYVLLGRAASTRFGTHAYGCILVSLCGISVYWFGRAGGADSPWIHAAIVLPAFTLSALFEWQPRAVCVLGVAAAVTGGFLLANPQFERHPNFGTFGATIFMSSLYNFGIGALLYRLVQSHFLRGRALERLATTDTLTGLLNRAAFLEAVDRELDRAIRYARPLALLVLDIDRFKAINDTHGHAVGDRALAHLGQVLRAVLRRSDVAGRLGGDEFAVLLPESDVGGARHFGERIRNAVAASQAREQDRAASYTISIGATARGATDRETATLVAHADKALYAAKRGGRDRVDAYDPGTATLSQ